MTQAPPAAPHRDVPLITAVIPTYNRIPQLLNLLRGLARQTLPAHLFEVVVSDDGSTDPVRQALQELEFPYAFTFLRHDNAGPAAARNRALEQARGRLTLILNDDAVPAPDLLQVHLNAHARRQLPVAVLGSFPFVEASLSRPFVRLVEETDLVFNFIGLKAGRTHDWRSFWTCNISLSTQALVAVDGFDESFKDPMCEDIELGYRLEKIGIPVLYLPEARCRHDHDLDADRFARRQECLGRNLVHLCEKYPGPEMARNWGLNSMDAAAALSLRRLAEAGEEQAEADLLMLRAFDAQPLPGGDAETQRLLHTMESLARRLSVQRSRKGMAAEWTRRHGQPEEDPRLRHLMAKGEFHGGASPGTVLPGRAPVTSAAAAKVSIIIPCINGFEHTRPCLDSIKAHTRGPHEVIVVDNGSGAETLAALRARTDICLMEMGENIGAPAARNRGIEQSSGDVLIFLDNDTQVTPGWIEGLAAHTRANPRVGLVGPMSNTVSGSQLAADPDYNVDDLDRHASTFSASRRGQHHYVTRLILFCLYVHRQVLDHIGGFDPAFGRWGFEDDDFCLRAAVAGFRLRVAEDVFIHHTGSRTSVAAGIDYNELLRTNWGVFKKKWGLPADLAYGAPYPLQEILQQAFDDERHVVPLQSMTPHPGARS